MNFKKGELVIAFFTLIYVIAFSIYYFSTQNYEFVLYIGVVVFFSILIGKTLRKTNFDYLVLWGLSIWGLLHMAGGGVRVNGAILHKLMLIPIVNSETGLVILRFDQFVHFFGFGVATLAVFQLMKNHLKKKPTEAIYFIVFLAGLGLGAINKVIEFIVVVIVPETNVGGYFNTALDLVFNSLGALAAIFISYLRNR